MNLLKDRKKAKEELNMLSLGFNNLKKSLFKNFKNFHLKNQFLFLNDGDTLYGM